MPVKPPTTLEIPVSIRKADIPAYAALHGTTNSRTAFDKPAKSLRFVSFFGSLDVESGKYTGVYRFDIGSFSDDAAKDLNKLPGLKQSGDHSDGL